MKGTISPEFGVIFKTRSYISSEKQVPFHEFDLTNPYCLVVRCETIRIFIARSAAQNLIAEFANIYNAYLYKDMEQDEST